MDIAIKIGLFVAGAIIGIFGFSNTILPIFFVFPRSLFYVGKGDVKFHVCIAYLLLHSMWIVVLVVAYIILHRYFIGVLKPGLLQAGFFFGGFVAICRLFSSEARRSMNDDFWAFVNRSKS